MITLTDENIRKFQTLYKEHFGIEISAAEAKDQGMKLIRLILVVCEKPCEAEPKAPTLTVNNKHNEH